MNLRILKEIVSGHKNFIFPSKEIEELANVRAEICASCEHADPNHPFKKFIPEEKRIEIIKGLGCKLCGCPLSAKTRSVMSTCPKDKW
mgnify:CR=1 FL=1